MIDVPLAVGILIVKILKLLVSELKIHLSIYTQWKKVTGHFIYLNINAKWEYFLIACWTPTPLNTLMNTSRHTIDQLLIGFPGNSFPLFF